MPRVCKTCHSPNRAVLEEWYLKDRLTVKEIHQRATQPPYNERISYDSLKRHFRLHVIPMMEVMKKVNKLRRTKIEQEFKRDIEVTKSFREKFQLIQDNIDELKDNMTELADRRVLIDLIKVYIDLFDRLMKWGEELGINSEKDYNVEARVNHCLAGFPPELIKKFIDRWEEYEGNRQ